MDPLAHTLLGAALAKTRLGRSTPLAMPTLVLAANVPDVDVAAYFWSSDAALAFRRGLTHGPLGLALLPALVAIVVWLAGRRWGRYAASSRSAATAAVGHAEHDDPSRAAPDPGDWAHRRPAHPGPAHRAAAHPEPAHPAAARRHTAAAGAAPVELAPLLALSYLGALTHPALDWLNTYGVRFLHPFDTRWFYGDALFIVDPWMWLVLGGALFLAHRTSRRSLVLYASLAVVATVLVVGAADSTAGKALWVAGLLAVVSARATGRPRTERARQAVATAAVAAFALYVVALLFAAGLARGIVRDSISAPVDDLLVGPLPVTPLRREVVVSTPDEIRYGRFGWISEPRLTWSGWSRPRPTSTPVVDAALADPTVQGFLGWARFLFVEIDEYPDFFEVHLMDARYTLERNARFGSAVVRVPKLEHPSLR